MSHFRTVSFLWVCTLLGSAIGFLTQTLIARSVSVEDYGVFTSVLGVVGMCAPLAGFGVSAFWLKVFGEEGEKGSRWLPKTLEFTLVTTVLVVFCVLVWASFGPHDENIEEITQVLSLTILGLVVVELYKALLQIEGHYNYFAWLQVLYPFVRFFAAFLVILFMADANKVLAISYAFSGISIVIFVLGVFFFLKLHFKNVRYNPKGHFESGELLTLGLVFSKTWMYGIGGVFYFLWSQSHVVFLKYLQSAESAAYYAVAVLFMNAVCLMPAVIYSKFLMPKIHRWASTNTELLREVYYIGNRYMLLIGLIFCVGVYLFSGYFIVSVFGEKYIPTVEVLKILSIVLPVRFVGHSVGALLVAKTYMKEKIKVMAIVAFLNVLMNLFLIPEYGMVGVAFTTVLCEVILVLLYFYLVQKHYGYKQLVGDTW